jgi:hypothetical protein
MFLIEADIRKGKRAVKNHHRRPKLSYVKNHWRQELEGYSRPRDPESARREYQSPQIHLVDETSRSKGDVMVLPLT